MDGSHDLSLSWGSQDNTEVLRGYAKPNPRKFNREYSFDIGTTRESLFTFRMYMMTFCTHAAVLGEDIEVIGGGVVDEL